MLNRVGSTPFLLAAKAADLELMRLLVELGADPSIPNEDGTTALMVAAGVGIWAVGESPGTNEEAMAAVKYALELGGDVTTVDGNGDTALHGAVLRSSEPLVRFLLGLGADIDAVNDRGWTPLRMAKGIFYSNTGKRFPEMETLLLELGADETLATGPDNTISDWLEDPSGPDRALTAAPAAYSIPRTCSVSIRRASRPITFVTTTAWSPSCIQRPRFRA